MFGSVFGLYSVRIAFTMASYDHDRGVVSAFKIGFRVIPVEWIINGGAIKSVHYVDIMMYGEEVSM
eukprot:scaffold7590_cov154-Skeletonema_menzelii.AAC.1